MPHESGPGLTPADLARVQTTRGSIVAVESRGSGTPILALPGLGGGAYFFRGFARRLAARAQVVTLDLPGTGRSTAGGDGFSLDSWVADLGEIVEQHIQAPVVIVGHSLGTILALAAWGAWPAWIRGLVFVGGLPAPRQPIRDRLTARLAAIGHQRGLAGFGPQVSPGVFAASAFTRIPEVIGLFERAFEDQVPLSYVRSARILIGASATDVAPTIKVPCLAVVGHEDQYAPPADVAAFMQRVPAPHAHETVVIPDCGHLPFLEAPDVFASAVRAFLDHAEL